MRAFSCDRVEGSHNPLAKLDKPFHGRTNTSFARRAASNKRQIEPFNTVEPNRGHRLQMQSSVRLLPLPSQDKTEI
jgi:hypothetical protein